MTPDLVQQIHHENLWLRDLLTAVAEDLEHVVGRTKDAEHKALLEARAMRIRQRLWEGPPKFNPSGTVGSDIPVILRAAWGLRLKENDADWNESTDARASGSIR